MADVLWKLEKRVSESKPEGIEVEKDQMEAQFKVQVQLTDAIKKSRSSR